MDNFENIESLKKILKNKQNTAVFVGAGASKLLGIRTWTEILIEMAKTFGSTEYDDDRINKYLFINKGSGHSHIAEEIFNENPDEELYKSFMKSQFIAKSTDSIGLHSKIANLFNVILTTNYDTTFETKFQDNNVYLSKWGHEPKSITVYKLPIFSLSKILVNDITIAYLHGNNERQNYIFLDKEYKTYYPNNYSVKDLIRIGNTDHRLEDFLKMMINEFNLLFIGFSFADENFIKLFRRTYIDYFQDSPNAYRNLNGDTLNFSKPNYFAIVPESIIDTYEWEFLEKHNFKCITFPDKQFIEIEHILNKLQTSIHLTDKPGGEGAYGN